MLLQFFSVITDFSNAGSTLVFVNLFSKKEKFRIAMLCSILYGVFPSLSYHGVPLLQGVMGPSLYICTCNSFSNGAALRISLFFLSQAGSTVGREDLGLASTEYTRLCRLAMGSLTLLEEWIGVVE